MATTLSAKTIPVRYFFAVATTIMCLASPETPMPHPTDALTTAFIQAHQTSVENMENTEIIKGFSGDKIWKSAYKNDKVLVRLHATNKALPDRLREFEATERASQLGIGPTLLFGDAQHRFIVTTFIDGKQPNRTEMGQSPYLNKLINQIKTLHQSPPMSHPWSIFDYIHRKSPNRPNKIERRSLSELKRIQKRLREDPVKPVPSHNDIHPGNIIIQHETPYLVDWGDAGMHDPFWDLARISMEFALSASQEDAMLTEYFNRPANKRQHNRLYIMKQIYILRCAFWLKNFTGRPNLEQLHELQKIFEVNGLPMTPNNEVYWHDISLHYLKLFTQNQKSKHYQKALKKI